MGHEQIWATQSVERYALDEMEIRERDAFEEHYFDCTACADEVGSAISYIANLQVVLKEGDGFSPAA